MAGQTAGKRQARKKKHFARRVDGMRNEKSWNYRFAGVRNLLLNQSSIMRFS